MSDDCGSILETLEEHDSRLIKLREFQLITEGKDGTNGRLGVLKDDVSTTRKILAAVAIAALGALGGAVGAVWHAASESGAEKARLERVVDDVDALNRRVDSLWSITFHLPPVGTP